MQLLRGMTAGLLGGLAASWVMNRFQELQPRQSGPQSGEGRGRGETHQSRSQTQQREPSNADEDATVKTAERISQRVFHHELSDREKQIAGPAVHYAYGALVGALYGGMAELLPVVSAGLGMPFGTALWLLGDEIAVPALGLSKPPTEYGAEEHADALASHLVYGLTTDLLRRTLRHVV